MAHKKYSTFLFLEGHSSVHVFSHSEAPSLGVFVRQRRSFQELCLELRYMIAIEEGHMAEARELSTISGLNSLFEHIANIQPTGSIVDFHC